MVIKMLKSKRKFLNLFLLLLPVIDLLTALMSRFEINLLSAGSIIKSIILLYFVIYALFFSNSRFKKVSIIVYAMILIYVCLYFVFKPQLLLEGFFFREITFLIKAFFYPLLFFSLICYFDDCEFNKDEIKKILLINSLIYSFILLISHLTGTAFNTYIDGSKGFIGWFYSGNEVSAIVVLLLPFVYYLLNKNKILFLIAFLFECIAISLIGTKVTLFGVIIISFVMFIATLIKHKLSLKTICSLVTLSATLIIFLNSYAVYNMKHIMHVNQDETKASMIIKERLGQGNKLIEMSLKLLSGRNIYILNTSDIYSKIQNKSKVFLGIGFSNTSKINNIAINKLIEMDLLDLFYHMGIFGLIIVILPYCFALFLFLKSLIKKITKLSTEQFVYIILLLLSFGISLISGHVLLDPAVSIYIILILILFLNQLKLFEKKIKNNKIQILSLHLDFGGAERSTVDLANMLSEKYEVELISLYKINDEIPYKINPRINVFYLSDLKPNRNEFMTAWHNRNIISILKEGFKSIYIIYKKHYLSMKCVEYSDADYFISTRIFFTKILNKCGIEKSHKIAIEHNYDISDKYIKKLIVNTRNMDELVCVSKIASEVYKKHSFKPNICYIPNIVSDEYDTVSQLKDHNIIYVGRLEPEKGVLDLIDVMVEVHKLNSKIKLNIFGDGSLRNQLLTEISNNKLEDIIYIHGFKEAHIIKDYYNKSSMLIVTSLKESFGIVILEAMKCGVPCIAFDSATGACELIKDNVNGYLIENRNSLKMAQKIVEYFNLSNKEKKNMQKNAIETSSKYSFKYVQNIWFKLLKKRSK